MDLAGIVTAFIMLSLPVRYFKRMWKILQGRSNVMNDDADINFSSAMWGIISIRNYGDKSPVIINITQIGYMILFTIFNIILLKNRCNCFVILLELPAFYVLARLAVTFHDPVEFAKTVCATATVFASLMRVICGPSFENAAALFANGVIWSIFGLLLSDTFILVERNL